jgi:hypothetical protein
MEGMRIVSIMMLALAGCSLIGTSARPHHEDGGATLACDSYVYPALDVVGGPIMIAAGGLLAVGTAAEPGSSTGFLAPAALLGVGITLLASSIAGFSRNRRCGDILDAPAPRVPDSAE